MMLVRQSTTVPNTSNSRACTSGFAAMGVLLTHSMKRSRHSGGGIMQLSVRPNKAYRLRATRS